MANSKHWRFIRVKDHSEWTAFRSRGIGGSEVGAALGISKYQSRLALYLEKIGEPVTPFSGNRFSNFGLELEAEIARWYTYWEKDQDVDAMFLNLRKGRRTRNVRKPPGILVNDRFPWLLGNVDRLITGDQRGRGFLETKNSTQMEARTYHNGFNPAFWAQVQQYMLLGEFSFADIGAFYDGNNMTVIQVDPDERWFEAILEDTLNLWNSVEKARAIKAKWGIDSYYGRNIELIPEKHRGAIYDLQKLEPELTGHEHEREIIRELVIPTEEVTSMNGTPEQRTFAETYKQATVEAKKATAQKEAAKNRLILSLGGIHVAQFPDGYFSYKPTKKGINTFRISPNLSGEDVDG